MSCCYHKFSFADIVAGRAERLYWAGIALDRCTVKWVTEDDNCLIEKLN